MNVKKILVKAFIPIERNSDTLVLNVDAILALVGLGVWAICALGEAFGFAIMPSYVADMGQILFGVGLGRASKGEIAPPSGD